MPSPMGAFAEGFRGFHADSRRFVYASIIGGFGNALVQFLFLLYLNHLGYGWVEFGIASGVMQGAMTIPLMFGGWLGDRFGRKAVVIAGSVLNIAGIAGIAFGINFSWILLGAALWGLGHALFQPSFMAFLSEKCDEKKRKFLFSFIHFATMMAMSAGTFLAGIIPGLFANATGQSLVEGYRFVFLLGLVFVVFQVAPLLSLKEEKAESGQGREGSEPGRSCWRSRKSSKDHKKLETAKAGHEKTPKKTLVQFCLPMMFLGIGAGLVVPFFQVYFDRRFGTPIEEIGYLFAVTNALWGLAYLLIPHLAQRIGSVKTVTLVQVAAIVALVGIPISSTFHFVAVMYITRMVLMNSTWPIVQSYTLSQTPPARRGLTLATVSFAFDGPKSLTPLVAGAVFALSMELPFYICAWFYTVATMLYFFFFYKRDDRIVSEAPLPPSEVEIPQ